MVFSSPHVVRRLGVPSGEARGIDELRAYWGSGLDGEPDLRFTVEDVRASVDTIVINYRNQQGHAVTEVLRFRDGQVWWRCGAAPANPGDAVATDRCVLPGGDVRSVWCSEWGSC